MKKYSKTEIKETIEIYDLAFREGIWAVMKLLRGMMENDLMDKWKMELEEKKKFLAKLLKNPKRYLK